MEVRELPGETSTGLDRRTVLRRGAILGGALVWTVPAVQTLAGPAFAAGSPCVGAVLYIDTRHHCLEIVYKADTTCCDCVASLTPTMGGNVAFAAVLCQLAGQCQIQSTGKC